MQNLMTIAFEAHSVEENHHRRYEITVGRDLLDDWTVAIHYGRVGQNGQEKRYASAKQDEMKAILLERLRRRLSAPRRIGCPYRLKAFHADTSFDTAAWLPGEVMAGFFKPA
jgi:predicted DNA-binding WGR domain protein